MNRLSLGVSLVASLVVLSCNPILPSGVEDGGTSDVTASDGGAGGGAAAGGGSGSGGGTTGPIDLILTQTPDPARVGSITMCEMKVQNLSAEPVDGVQLSSLIPAKYKVLLASSGSPACTQAASGYCEAGSTRLRVAASNQFRAHPRVFVWLPDHIRRPARWRCAPPGDPARRGSTSTAPFTTKPVGPPQPCNPAKRGS